MIRMSACKHKLGSLSERAIWSALLLTSLAAGVYLLVPVAIGSAQDSPSLETDPGTSSTPAPVDTGPTTAAKKRTLLDTLMDGGVVGLLIVILSMVSVYFIVEHFLTIRKSALMPDETTEQLEGLVHQGKLDEAIQYCQQEDNQSLISDVILAGLTRYRSSEFGFAEYKAAVEEAGEHKTGELYRKTEVLNLIGAIAPMLGLTGTVLGMINAFNTIASTEGRARPDELAAGIGQALVTTLIGLVVAIPTMIAFSYFRNRIDSIIAEAGKRVEQVLMPLSRRK